MTARAAHNRAHAVLCGSHGNQSISYAGSLSDAHFIRLRRIADAAQRSWDRVRCIGTRPHSTRRMIWPGITGEDLADSLASAASERELFTRAMMTPQSSTRIDFTTQFGVEWLDPTGDRKLIERLLTFPLHVFRIGNRPRGLARELGRGLLPDSVRLRRRRSTLFPDQTAWFVLRADDYRKVFQSIRESGVCASILDIERLAALLDTLCAGVGTVADSQLLHRALDAGSFALGFESRQRPEWDEPLRADSLETDAPEEMTTWPPAPQSRASGAWHSL
jgi:Asparagine synthase